jgi:hypothetical protein
VTGRSSSGTTTNVKASRDEKSAATEATAVLVRRGSRATLEADQPQAPDRVDRTHRPSFAQEVRVRSRFLGTISIGTRAAVAALRKP